VRYVARRERRLAGAEDDLLGRDEQRELAPSRSSGAAAPGRTTSSG
jgi:hypothetical protein